MNTLRTVVFLGKFLVSQKLGVHSPCRDKLGSLDLLDAIGMGLVSCVVCASILLL